MEELEQLLRRPVQKFPFPIPISTTRYPSTGRRPGNSCWHESCYNTFCFFINSLSSPEILEWQKTSPVAGKSIYIQLSF